MARPGALTVAGVGTLAVLLTTATFILNAMLAHSIPNSDSPIRIYAIISALSEALALIALCRLLSCHYGFWMGKDLKGDQKKRVWLGTGMSICCVGAALSVATFAGLSKVASSLRSRIAGFSSRGFLAGSSVVVGLVFVTQSLFLVLHFFARQTHNPGALSSMDSKGHCRRRPATHLKSVPYDETSPVQAKLSNLTMSTRTPPGSSGGRSTTETMGSLRSSLFHLARPLSSKAHLLSTSQRSSRSYHRAASLDSNCVLRPSSGGGTFETWDTSAVDPQNRQTVLDTSILAPPRVLETIPASPNPSRSPSPGMSLNLTPSRSGRRSRSYSPASTRSVQAQRATFTQHSAASESHIHPLFRSDSPTPPPAVTPGTVVVAAPNAGQVLTNRNSVWTLSRMHSLSLPNAPSPLSWQGSFEPMDRRPDTMSCELPEEEEGEDEPIHGTRDAERNMTPPIPDWILTAGSRKSLVRYNSKRVRPADGSGAVSLAKA